MARIKGRPPLEITYNGETMSARKWQERTGIPATRITERLKHGWTPERALTTPVREWIQQWGGLQEKWRQK